MTLDEPGLRQLVAAVSALAGAGGAVSVFVARPRRASPAHVTLLAAFAALLAAGATGIEGTPLADAGWTLRLAGLGGLTLLAGALLTLRECRVRDRSLQAAVAESDARRREVERLGSTNVRLEDELQTARSKIGALESAGAQSEATRTGREAAALRQKKALDAANAADRRLRTVFDGAIEGMALLERDTLRLVTVNASLARMTGFDPPELEARTLVDLFAESPGRPAKADLQRAGRERRVLTSQLLRKDGGVTHADLTVTVIGAAADAQLLVVVRDASERNVCEQEVQLQLTAAKERGRQLEAANRELAERTTAVEQEHARMQDRQAEKDHCVSTVSHELRTPLTSISSFSEILLAHDDVEPAVRREFLEIIHRESARLTRLVNNVLDLARIEAGETRIDIAEFDLRGAVDDAVASVSGMAAQRGVSVASRTGGVPRLVCGDRDKIQQLAINLVSNAVKFSPAGAEVEVEVKDGHRPGRVEICVTDHGPGIATAELELVFEKFRRAGDGPARGVPGTGLGLAICREIASLHGGRIWAESAPGEGSRFRVDLPDAEEARRIVTTAPPRQEPKGDAAAKPQRAARAAAEPAAKPSRRREPAAAAQSAARDAQWSTTGSLPPLRIAAPGAPRDGGPPSGELPPIR